MLSNAAILLKNSAVFRDCAKISSLTIKSLITNLDIHWSPLINKEDLIYLLTFRLNVANSAIIITLHTAVYSWASVDPEITALLPAGNYKNKEVGEAKLATV